ncbi:MAG TPA: protein-methionine-sulfoxide reductase heme-binding subunit MsrQ [Stellaceae bacterium]|nr:protein-methionine-sulfoxide reductase heme-binding subunit MsrQ [Stellaceae bacterium]
MYPWKDYGGRTSPLKLAVFVALFGPAAWVVLSLALGWLEPRPYTAAIREIGLWTIRLIFLALAVTPLRQVLQWPKLIEVRRMIGVAACAYALCHLTLYTADMMFDLARVAREIVLRIYLTIGFAAVLGLAAMAATSTDGMVRRLGPRKWQRLHRLVYLIALLAVVHFCMQSKLDLWEPTIMAGLYAWLMGYRLLTARWLQARLPWRIAVRGRLPFLWVGALGIAAALLTALGEAAYFAFAYHAGPGRVIAANWSLTLGLRPAAAVFGIAAAVLAAGALRSGIGLLARRRPHFA